MKIQFLFSALLLLPVGSYAGQPPGIQFATNSTRTTVVKQSAAQYRYIFIELVAEGDQAAMDAANQSAATAEYYNKRFISFRFGFHQLNTLLQLCPAIASIPLQQNGKNVTHFFYLSPAGGLVHIARDVKRPEELLALGKQAINPSTQYFPAQARYRSGIKEYSIMPDLAVQASMLGNQTLGQQIAQDYISNYLERLPQPEMARKENTDFIDRYPALIQPNAPYYQLFTTQPQLADQEKFNGYSQSVIEKVIKRVEISPYTDNATAGKEPDWEALKTRIRSKYNHRYADKLVEEARLAYLRGINNWQAFATARNRQLTLWPPQPGTGLGSDGWILNTQAWDAFKSTTDTFVLQSALQWISVSLQSDPQNVQYLDTKANLLYKLGKVAAAITTEQQALQEETRQAHNSGFSKGGFSDEFAENIRKMKAGIPTWTN